MMNETARCLDDISKHLMKLHVKMYSNNDVSSAYLNDLDDIVDEVRDLRIGIDGMTEFDRYR